ncbi:MAG: AAA family ATPase [Fimbriimonas ginsengisoli]|uniref:AAA family ATPase n=1 Tax=Fimbriimonas ginsengisoli TaxID=1005039 RepID=A0A931LSY9_FIMGI|nr:AAA family ATPase [Fimbriimonas ginsengisoli]
MYESFWGLTEPPFSLTPDPRFLYMSRSHEDALMMLHYAVTRNKGAAVLIGDIGLGKTTVSRKLLDLLDPLKFRVVLIVNPILTPVQILQEILDQLDAPTASRNRQVLVSDLHDLLLECYERGQRIVLMIDEAHLIRSANTLEELRLLLNCQMNDQFLISLVLLGQNELRPKLARVPALEQRLAIRQTLRPLDVTETGEMLLHRLRVAGFTGEHSPFTPDAVFEIQKFSNGTPRLSSQIADNAMLVSMGQRVQTLDAFLVHGVIAEFTGERVAA